MLKIKRVERERKKDVKEEERGKMGIKKKRKKILKRKNVDDKQMENEPKIMNASIEKKEEEKELLKKKKMLKGKDVDGKQKKNELKIMNANKGKNRRRRRSW